jgi:hypothetical protein
MSIDRYALCVGINKYSDTRYTLNGCVNDAKDWGALLESRGYQVTYLIDGDATRSNMVSALTEQVSRLGYRDRLVFTYSGHGSWIPDQSGDEVDGRDEALVSQDLRLILDDDLYPILSSRAYGSRVTTISDSCHSGTVTRGLVDLFDAREGLDTPRFISPALLDVAPYEDIVTAAKSGAVKSISRNTGVLLAGAKDDEYSYDTSFNGRPNGALSRFAIDAFSSGLTYQQWFTALRNSLPSGDYPQTPQLGGTYTQKRWVALD